MHGIDVLLIFRWSRVHNVHKHKVGNLNPIKKNYNKKVYNEPKNKQIKNQLNTFTKQVSFSFLKHGTIIKKGSLFEHGSGGKVGEDYKVCTYLSWIK